MRKLLLFFCCTYCILPVVAGQLYKSNVCASFYADQFHGRMTANGELFDMNSLTAAHKTLPFNTMLRITNLANGKKVDVRINDRGPFVKGREIDVSKAAAIQLGMVKSGTAMVSIEIITKSTKNTEFFLQRSAIQPTPQSYKKGSIWIIQIGAYGNRKNAEQMAQQLINKGFSPSYEKAGSITRVILANIPAEQLQKTEKKLQCAGFSKYAVRESTQL